MTCKNCESHLEETDNYCRKCGAQIIRNRLTIGNIFNYIGEQYFNIDNRFLQTFITLFTKPEEVIESYINGTRKKYADAISYFAVAVTMAGLQLFVINKFFPDAMDFSKMNKDGNQFTIDMQNDIQTWTSEYHTLFMMFYIPLYALFSKLIFINIKKFNYTEHLVIFMYIQSQYSIFSFFYTTILLALDLPFTIVGFSLMPLLILYSAYCLKRLHDLSLAGIILKTVIFSIAFFILFVLFSLVVAGIYLLMHGVPDTL
ncbi:DUF3667 domain-containing protein [Mangrovimonas futianensis]|uniref:DUF3667 domain-containing protein n=1 Tax=Mangrovimonas futianensis TaxID=2895523 RepID=UPI001E309D2C|nr:DUF3667 domain-containing protein [Mangrovimonas futianensis]MCF1421099.1 DUF3667 domain-containing protein [Mangrovimonas futianensis]